MEMQIIPSKNLIHVGDFKLSKSLRKKIKTVFKEHFKKRTSPVNIVNIAEILTEEEIGSIKSKLTDAIEEYAYFYMTLPNKLQPLVKLSGLAELKAMRILKDVQIDYGFDVHSIENINKILTVYINLTDIEEEGEIEFYYQELKIRPSKNEIIIFPSYFSHLHKFNKSKKDRYFLKASFFIGGQNESN